MKLAFVGAANSPHTIKWVNALTEKGHQVTLFTLPDHKDAFSEISPHADVKPFAFSEAQNGFKKNAKELRAHLAAGGFDAVAALGMTTYGALAVAAKTPNLLMVSTGIDVYGAKPAGKLGLVKKCAANAKAVAATAPNVITKIKEVYKKEQNYFVTPFGVDMDLFQKPAHKKERELCVGSVKFLEEWNRVDLTIDAFNRFLKKADQPYKLLVVGDGTQESALKRKAEELGIADSVEFLGYVKNADMPAVMARMDVLVQMTPTECFGVSAVEAMACAVPVVASDTYGASEYVLNSVTGYLVKAGNADACADRIADLMKNDAARKKMGESCREDVLPLYNLKDCVDKFEEALKKVK